MGLVSGCALEVISDLLELEPAELKSECEHWAQYFELEQLTAADVWLAKAAPAKLPVRDPHYPLHRAGDAAYILLRTVDTNPPPDYYTRAAVSALLDEMVALYSRTLN